MLLQLFVTACLKVKTGQNSKQLREMKKLADRSKEVKIYKKQCLGLLEGGRGRLIDVAV